MVMGRSLHHALDRDPIFRAVSSFYGVTTANGLATTLVCDALLLSNDFITGKVILLDSGASAFETRAATGFVAGTITVNPAFSAAVLAGTGFYILTQQALAAALAASTNQGLVYYGVVTAVPGAGQFTIPTLAGLGDAKFIDLAGVAPYYAFVLRDASGPGAAPQGESRPITGYATLTGNFVVNPNFTADVAAGDEILIIHPFLARIMNLYGLPPVVGTRGGVGVDWSTGFATSGEAGQDLVTIGAAGVKYKIHSLLINISAFTPAATITVRMFQRITGAPPNGREVYHQTFLKGPGVGSDPDGLWIINGTVGIHEALRVEVHSTAAGDDHTTCDFDYMLEAM